MIIVFFIRIWIIDLNHKKYKFGSFSETKNWVRKTRFLCIIFFILIYPFYQPGDDHIEYIDEGMKTHHNTAF